MEATGRSGELHTDAPPLSVRTEARSRETSEKHTCEHTPLHIYQAPTPGQQAPAPNSPHEEPWGTHLPVRSEHPPPELWWSIGNSRMRKPLPCRREECFDQEDSQSSFTLKNNTLVRSPALDLPCSHCSSLEHNDGTPVSLTSSCILKVRGEALTCIFSNI